MTRRTFISHQRVAAGIVAAALLLAGSSAATAGPITLNTRASVSGGPTDNRQATGVLTPSTDLSLQSSSSGAFPNLNLTEDLSAAAFSLVNVTGGSLTFGVSGSSSGQTTIGAGGPVGANSDTTQTLAAMDLEDLLTVVGAPSTGFLSMNFSIDGQLSTTTSSPNAHVVTAAAGGDFWVNSNTTPSNFITLNTSSQSNGTDQSSTTPFPTTFAVLIPFSSSVADMLLHLDTITNTSDNCFSNGLNVSTTCTETADGALGHTVTLNYISVLDTSHQLVPNAFVTGDSGISYANAPAAPVPEPGGLVLLGTGLVTLASRLRRRRPA